ncbi:hypothetical protein, partial [Gemmiger formicilis]|uniref:hypothetical protein n=1 Tax=Gemmiger formicilis TaxID=745368 RepID=UPI00195D40A8
LRNVMVGWCDGAALYGYCIPDPAVGNSTGYRISLADGTVPLDAIEARRGGTFLIPAAAEGHQFLVGQVLPPLGT